METALDARVTATQVKRDHMLFGFTSHKILLEGSKMSNLLF
jgi:hypothetical protein